MAYDFSRFSPQSFELFIQALAVAVAGEKVQIFGAGRDGAREATYEGRLMLGGTAWDGYTIFQAKHRQFTDTPAKDADWLIKELETELDKFTDPKRNLRKPDFYVLASNVRLSASAANAKGKGEGGVDKVSRRLKAKAKQAGIKDVCLWHADTLSSLLETHTNVRQSYAFWVQPGDVLAALLQEIEGPSKEEVLVPYLRRSLKDAREIKTKDIGQAIGRTVMLEEVFVDLPIYRQTHTSTGMNTEIRGQLRRVALNHTHHNDDTVFDDELEDLFAEPAIVAELMWRAANKFEPQDYALEKNQKHNRRSGEVHLKNRIVLLGGPGQGKSTVGQFVAQLCRARLLNTLQIAQAPETNQTVEAILKCAQAEQIPLVGPPRYPFHIELPRYADALSAANREEKGLSILAHVASDINRSHDNAVKAAKIRKWIGELPTLVILDGLDEVPRSGNREAVIKAIEDLLDTIHEVNGDCLIFCTSRQQGYQQELNPLYWAHWLLEPLSSDASLRLARGVSNVLVSEETRREEILATLSEAAEDATTSPLMISPLQVMLLFQLVSTHNNIPKDRWTLFQRHYETLRDREITKGGVTGKTINRHRSQIDSIHRDAGYLLHLRAEKAGGANAYLTDSEFEHLVLAQLLQDGYEGEATELAPEITHLATNRLVFLRSQVGGQVAFDVRSLQEFMAAARITASPENLICERLTGLAGRVHWLHVFKIACSKIFGSNAHEALRTPVISLLDSLDAGDRSVNDRLLRIGARLALQLLTDGTSRSIPIFERKLVVRALRLINIRSAALQSELAQTVNFQERGHLEPLFLEVLSNAEGETRLQALRLLAHASRHGPIESVAWTKDLLEQHWPDDPSKVLEVFDSPYLLPEDRTFVSRIRQAQWEMPIDEVVLWMDQLLMEAEDEASITIPEDFFICSNTRLIESTQLLLQDDTSSGVIISYRGMNSAVILNEEPICNAHNSWRVAAAAAAFAEKPGINQARSFLEIFAKYGTFDRKIDLICWPLKGLLIYANKHRGIAPTITELESGNLGDEKLWALAEVRWRDEGIRIDGLAAMFAGDAMALNWHGVTAPMPAGPGGLRPRRSMKLSLDSILALVKSFPDEPHLLLLLFNCISRNGHSTGDGVSNFLLSIDPLKNRGSFPWRGYINALSNTYTLENFQPLLSRLLVSLQYSGWNLPDLSAIRKQLILEFRSDESQRQILKALAVSFRGNAYEDFSGLPLSAYSFCDNDCDEIKSAVVMIRILAGRIDPAETKAIKTLLSTPPNMFSTFLRYIANDSSERYSQITLAICRAALTSTNHLRFQFEELMAIIEEAIPVPFSDSEVAERLKLPIPLQDRPQIEGHA